jgi:hypothetical protein
MMSTSAVLPGWAPRVKQRLIQQLYENDARGFLDEELLSEVGWGFYARCQSFLIATQALHGQVPCPVCHTVIFHGARPEEILHCAACGWQCTWQAYHQTFQHRQLSGGEEVCALFQDFIHKFPKASDAREKMLLIDVLIHGWHWNLIRKMDTKMNTRAVGVNLIEGRLHEVVEFLDRLSSGESSTPGLSQHSQEWRQKLNQLAEFWGSDPKHKKG